MAFDAARGKIVLFGGTKPTANALNDTWEWDGTTWSQLNTPSSPPARRYHAMAYDSQRRKTVMFGGEGTGGPGDWLADTWEWDGSVWTEVSPSTSPSQRRDHAMAYDEARQRVVLYGGTPGTTETWLYDGMTWTKANTTTSPGVLFAHAMAYDEARQRVVMGGCILNQGTYEWDGTGWSRVATGPFAIGYTFAYDEVRHVVMMFGGGQPDTWEWRGVSWTQVVNATSPSRRYSPGMVYDSIRKETVLFGGLDHPQYFADTWTYGSGAPATYTTFGTGCGNPTLALTNTQLPRPGQPFELLLSNLPTFRAGAVFTGISNTTWGGVNLPFDLSFLGGAGCTLYVSGDVATPIITLSQPAISWRFDVPNNASFSGAQFFNQGLIVDHLSGLLSTNGGQATIGY